MVGISQVALFAGAFAASAMTPGPEIVSVFARSIAKGMRGLPGLTAGIIIGKLVLLGIAMAGLAAIAASFGPVFVVIKYIGASYLIFLAIKKWRSAGATVNSAQRESVNGIADVGIGIALTMSNPVAVAFYLALLPGVVDLDHVSFVDYLTLGFVIVVVMSGIVVAYGLAGARLRAFFDGGGKRIIDRVTALVFLVCALLLLLR